MVAPGFKSINILTGARYAGEKVPGDLEGWAALTSDPNQFLRGTYDLLSRRSVTLYHTYPPVAGAVDKQTDYQKRRKAPAFRHGDIRRKKSARIF